MQRLCLEEWARIMDQLPPNDPAIRMGAVFQQCVPPSPPIYMYMYLSHRKTSPPLPAVSCMPMPPFYLSRLLRHRNYDIIERFGRFPDRNAVCGRRNTTQERSFLGKAPVLGVAFPNPTSTG